MCKRNSINAIMNIELTMLRLRQHIQPAARHKLILPHASRGAAGTANLARGAQRRTGTDLDRARCRGLMAVDGGVGFDALCAAFVRCVRACGRVSGRNVLCVCLIWLHAVTLFVVDAVHYARDFWDQRLVFGDG